MYDSNILHTKGNQLFLLFPWHQADGEDDRKRNNKNNIFDNDAVTYAYFIF